MKKIIFTLALLFSFFLAKADNFTVDPDSLCTVTFDTIQGGFCFVAVPTGVAPFTYLWDDGSTSNTACLNNPAGNTLCVVVTDAIGCVVTGCVTIAPNCSVWIYENNMLGMPLAQLEANASGSAPFSYLWNTNETTANINPTSSGTYCVTITDNDGCTSDACASINLNTVCDVYIYQDSTNNPNQPTSLVASASGLAPFIYTWNTGEVTDTIVPSATGNYCVTITAADSCTAEACYFYQTGGGNNCSVTIGNTGAGLGANASGTAPFSYMWSTGELTQTITPSQSGTYCVTVTDGNGCVSNACATFTVNANCDVFIYQDSTNNPNQLPTLVAAASGNAPFTYSWNTGEVTSSISVTQSGNYCVTITAADSCTAAACYFYQTGGGNNCSVTIGNTGAGLGANASGTAPFSYMWSTGELTQTITPSQSGTYCVTVTDGNGCVSNACATFTMNANCDVDIYQDSTNNPNQLPTLVAAASGNAPFAYSWNTGEVTSSIIVTQSGMYCVTITADDGCSASDCFSYVVNNPDSCFVSISSAIIQGTTTFELTANPSGVIAPYTYSWNTMEVTASIIVNTFGTYTVSVTDAAGCVAVATYYLGCNSNNFPQLYAWIDYDSLATSGNITYTAVPVNGVAPFTYQWDNGQATQTITDLAGAYHCVTITDNFGCTTSACVNSCYTYISVSGAGLTANPIGFAPFTYLWSTGETTPTITPTSSGSYCVTVTSGGGCVASNCTQFVSNFDINGFVFIDSTSFNTNNTAKVYLIEHDNVAGTLTAVDSLVTQGSPNSWSVLPYSFTNVPAGEYLVKAALEIGSSEYDDHLPTYYDGVLYWSEATTITVPNNPNQNMYNIFMVQGVNPGGPGFIGGLISEGANFTSGQVETRDEGDPVVNVDVLLLTMNDQAVTHTVTNQDGEFEFPNLAWGTYKIVVEILGKDPGEKIVTIGPDNTSVSVTFSVNETFVTGIEDVLQGASVKVFPNPTSDKVHLQMEVTSDFEVQVTVSNMLGKIFVSEKEYLNNGTRTLTVDLENLPSGVYFLNVSDGSGVISKKVIKN